MAWFWFVVAVLALVVAGYVQHQRTVDASAAKEALRHAHAWAETAERVVSTYRRELELAQAEIRAITIRRDAERQQQAQERLAAIEAAQQHAQDLAVAVEHALDLGYDIWCRLGLDPDAYDTDADLSRLGKTHEFAHGLATEWSKGGPFHDPVRTVRDVVNVLVRGVA